MENVVKNYYAWVPVLTNGIIFDYVISQLNASKEWRKINENIYERDHIEKDILNEQIHTCQRIEIDKDEKTFNVKISLIKDKINLICTANVKFLKNKYDNVTGLIKIDLLNVNEDYVENRVKDIKESIKNMKFPEDVKIDEDHIRKAFTKWFLREVYTCVKHAVHIDTHHDRSEDLLLDVVEAKNEEDAIKEIIGQFEKKVISYHMQMREHWENVNEKIQGSKSDAFAGRISKTALQAQGEMIYAQRLIELYKDDYQIARLIDAFQCAQQSLTHYGEAIRRDLEFQRNERIEELTRLGTIVGISILIFTGYLAIIGTLDMLDIIPVPLTGWSVLLPILIFISIVVVVITSFRYLTKRQI